MTTFICKGWDKKSRLFYSGFAVFACSLYPVCARLQEERTPEKEKAKWWKDMYCFNFKRMKKKKKKDLWPEKKSLTLSSYFCTPQDWVFALGNK